MAMVSAAAQNVPMAAMQASAAAGAASPAGSTIAEAQAGTTLAMAAADAKPPNLLGTVGGSALRGALFGASMMFGVNSFASPGGRIAGFLDGTIGRVFRMLPFVGKFFKGGFPLGPLVALGAGAAIGGVLGAVTGFMKFKKESAAYAAAQQAPPAGDPAGVPITPTGPAPTGPAPGAPSNPPMGPGYKGTGKKGAAPARGRKGKSKATKIRPGGHAPNWKTGTTGTNIKSAKTWVSARSAAGAPHTLPLSDPRAGAAGVPTLDAQTHQQVLVAIAQSQNMSVDQLVGKYPELKDPQVVAAVLQQQQQQASAQGAPAAAAS